MKNPKVITKVFKDKKRCARVRVVCPCGCKKHLDIYADDRDETEIGGVYASNKFWRELFARALFGINDHLNWTP